MVEVFTDKALSLDNLLSYGPMHSAFEEFMKQEKSMGKNLHPANVGDITFVINIDVTIFTFRN